MTPGLAMKRGRAMKRAWAMKRGWRQARRGTVALEAAIVISLAMSVSLGTIQLGLMSWTKAGLQATAAITARCMGIGATACTGIGGQAYAVAQSRRFLTSTAITAANVTVTTASTCGSTVGHFTKVVITSNQWNTSKVLPPFAPTAITVTACYNTSAT